MKKLFVAVLAIAALAACQKDEVSFVQSNKKAIDITIANAVEISRATTTPEASEIVADGQVGTIEVAATDQYAAAQANQLVVLFANSASIVEQAFAIEAGTTRYHNINESVTQVAIVRSVKDAVKGTDGAWTCGYNLEGVDGYTFVGKNLSTYRDAAVVEYTDNRSVDCMDLFVVGSIGEKVGTCKEANTSKDGHVTEYEYALYEVSLHVAPMLARVEITSVKCNDLGETTLAASQGQPVSGGYDHLTLGDLAFGGGKYTYDFADYVLEGAYCPKEEDVAANCMNYYDAIAFDNETEKGTVIAWNLSVNTPYPAVSTDADGNNTITNPLTIQMVAAAHDYTVVNNNKQLTVGFKGADKFEAGKIYRLAIDFDESNLDKSNEAICVDVTVTVQNWVVVDITPEYGN